MSVRERAPDARRIQGFTLLELLTALVIMGVAVSLFFQMFMGAYSLKDNSGKSVTAARVAEKTLVSVNLSAPDYEWPRYEEAEPGALIPLVRKGASSHVVHAGQPAETPTDRRAMERSAAHYSNLTAETYTCMPSRDANHVQVIVVVRWAVEGRPQLYSLTTTVPRTVAEG